MSVTRTMVCRYFIACPLEHLRRPGGPDFHLGARGDEISRDHLVVRLTRPDHRVDTRIRVDHHLEEGRAPEGEELGDHPRYVGLLVQAHRVAEAVRLRSLD